MSDLFTSFTMRSVTVRNRVWVSPMCQYSAEDGLPDDWHLAHLASFARGGAGLVMSEATAVVPEGRISTRDTGIWNDEQAGRWSRITGFVRQQGAIAAIQLAHAGRKASTVPPDVGRGPLADQDGGWTPVGPSPVPYPGLRDPRELDQAEIAGVVEAFAVAAQRAVGAGFEVVELHAAHGYLLHQFLSPLSNLRTDGYGGSFSNRTRFLREAVHAVRRRVDVPLLVRVSATDWLEGGWTLADTVRLAVDLRELGVDLIDTSTGGNAPAEIHLKPGYQVRHARRIREHGGIATGAVGLISQARQAEKIVASGDADVVFIGRAMLRNPHWALAAAHELGVDAGYAVRWPPQYERARPH